jgi:hypothetical protein
MTLYDNLPAHRTNEVEETPTIENLPPPKQIKPKRRTKKDIKDLISYFFL